jgi:hypothetical protein
VCVFVSSELVNYCESFERRARKIDDNEKKEKFSIQFTSPPRSISLSQSNEHEREKNGEMSLKANDNSLE